MPNVAPVNRPGTYLDIGCANDGYLLECLLAWTQLKGVEIEPYGLDYSAQLVRLARDRLPAYTDNIYIGNAWDWQLPQQFDYVRTELDYVPRNYRQAYIERLLTKFLTAKGTLILSHYRSRRDNFNQLGYPLAKIEAVKHCIATHRSSVPSHRNSAEAECLANADAVTHFEQVPSLLHFTFVQRAWGLMKGLSGSERSSAAVGKS